MSALTTSKIPEGKSPIASSDVNLPLQEIENIVNGGIDSLNIAASSITSSRLAADAVTNAKLSTAAGELGAAWQTWNPTFTNFNAGAPSTTVARYISIGKTVHFSISITLGAASSVGSIKASLPITAANNNQIPFQAFTLNAGIVRNTLLCFQEDTSNMALFALTSSGTYPAQATLSPTVPHTWNTGDTINIAGTYESI